MATVISKYERETVITFNEEEQIAHIFTYNRAWQRHLEGRMGLKADTDNGAGGRDYTLPKARIRKPMPKRPGKVMTAEQRAVVRKRFAAARQNAKMGQVGISGTMKTGHEK